MSDRKPTFILRAADQAYDRTLLASAKSIGEQLLVTGYDENAVLRATVPYSALEAFEADVQTRMYSLFYTSPVRESQYLGGRFLGALLVNVVLVMGVPLGLLVGRGLLAVGDQRGHPSADRGEEALEPPIPHLHAADDQQTGDGAGQAKDVVGDVGDGRRANEQRVDEGRRRSTGMALQALRASSQGVTDGRVGGQVHGVAPCRERPQLVEAVQDEDVRGRAGEEVVDRS